MRGFAEEESIFEDMDILNPHKDYIPENLPEREKELEQLHSILKPVTMGSTPINAFIYGKSGQGKTAAIEAKTEQLQIYADTNDIDLRVVHLQCQGMEKSYHVMTHLLKELRGPGADLPTGYQRKELWMKIRDQLAEIGGTVIIILDEMDGINDDYILYELPRLSIDNVKLSIIGITNDLQFKDRLSQETRSSLGEDEIEFDPYDAEQLHHILARRASKGLSKTDLVDSEDVADNIEPAATANDAQKLVSDVLTGDVIPLCSAFAASETGDARHALKLMFRACRYADDRDDDVVNEEHVRWAEKYIETRAVERALDNLPLQGLAALMAVTRASLKGETPIETSDLYGWYTNLCTRADIDQLSDRRFRDKLNDLAGVNILKKETKGRGRGQGVSNKYKLAVSPETVVVRLPRDESRLGEAGDMLWEMYQHKQN